MATYVSQEDDASGRKLAVYSADWLAEIAKRGGTSHGFDEASFLENFKSSFGTFETNAKPTIDLLIQNAIPTVFHTAKKTTEPLERRALNAQVELFFSGIVSQALRYADAKETRDTIMTLVANLCKMSSPEMDASEARMNTLILIANSLSVEMPLRFEVISKLLDFAVETGNAGMVTQYLRRSRGGAIWEYVDLPADTKRDFLLHAAAALKAARDYDGALGSYLSCLQGLQNEAENSPVLRDPKVVEAAVELASATLRLPSQLHCDKVDQLKAVHALKDTEHKALLQLLQCLGSGTLDDFDAIEKKEGELFQKYSINKEQCRKKLQLLSVAEFVKEKSEVSIDTLADALKVSGQEAEALVVAAVGRGLVDARVDQARRIINVTSAQPRRITKTEWQHIAKRLAVLKQSTEAAQQVWEEQNRTASQNHHQQMRTQYA